MAEIKGEEKRVGVGVGIILLRGGKILLGRRNPDPVKADSAFRSAGTWSLPGGKIKWGETLEHAAIREVKEETGITIRNPQVISLQNTKNRYAHFVTIGAIAKNWKGESKVMEPDEMVEWKWFSIKRLPYPRYFPSFSVINNFLKKRFYSKPK